MGWGRTECVAVYAGGVRFYQSLQIGSIVKTSPWKSTPGSSANSRATPRHGHEGYRRHRLQRESPQCRLSVNPHMIGNGARDRPALVRVRPVPSPAKYCSGAGNPRRCRQGDARCRVMRLRMLGLDGLERRILRSPHRLLDLLYWVVQRRLGQTLLLGGLRHRDRNHGRHCAQIGHRWQKARAPRRRI